MHLAISRVLGAVVVGLLSVVACSDDDPGKQKGKPDLDAGTDTGGDTGTDASDGGDSDAPGVDPAVARGETIFRRDCVACHTLGHGDLKRGPDLTDIHKKRPEPWLRKWLTDPAAVVAEGNPYAEGLIAKWGGIVMPDPELSDDDITDVLAYITHQSAVGPMPFTTPVNLSAAELDTTKMSYFNRCAGCHGTLRAGGTGPDIGEAASKKLGTDTLAAVVRNGRPWGMPAWGKEKLLSETEIAQMAAFLQLPPPAGPPLSLDTAKASWNVMVPVAQRPTAPEHSYDWQDFIGVILRDIGKVAIIDAKSRTEVTRIDTGFAVHILRASSTGRYFQAVGRDGWITLIDLWAKVPQAVAKVRGCFDARSVESSKLTGYEDKYAIEGCYWPPQYVVFDGLTLEPLAVHDVLSKSINGDELKEVRVASIVGVPGAPEWAVALKESGYVGIVDYSKPGFPMVTKIAAKRFLHDGGLDATGQYFMLAANAENRMVIIDLKSHSLASTFETGKLPHPGRGANWVDPTYGPVNATTHLGEGTMAVYGADPAGHAADAWKVVRKIALPAAGSLFLKTHPKSPWVVADMALATTGTAMRQICAYSKQDGKLDHCFEATAQGKALHPEFNRAGDEIWVSVWDTAGEIVIYDTITLKEKSRIKGLQTPTGKFNVYNTAHDVY
ncbi:MAG: c-type cytochrome [Polyangiaceae bacterium]|nr:c-type cytochrome [Polyangiaceae bacterium]